MLNMIFNGFLRCYWIFDSKISNFSMLKFLAWKFLAWKIAVVALGGGYFPGLSLFNYTTKDRAY